MEHDLNSADGHWLQKIYELFGGRIQNAQQLYEYLSHHLRMFNNISHSSQNNQEIDILTKEFNEKLSEVTRNYEKEIREVQKTQRESVNRLVAETEGELKKQSKEYERKLTEIKKEFQTSLRSSEEKQKREYERKLTEIKKEFQTSLRSSEEKQKKDLERKTLDLEKKIEEMSKITQKGSSSTSTSRENPEQISNKNENHKPVGLTNKNLNCYMNASLQALSASKYLVNGIKEWSNEYPGLKKLSCLGELLNDLNGKWKRDLDLVDNVLFREWNKDGMQDSFELIAYLMNQVIKEVKGHLKLKQSEWLSKSFPMTVKLVYSTICSNNHTVQSPIQTDLALHLSLSDYNDSKSYTLPQLIRESMEGEQVSDYSCQDGCLANAGIKFTKLQEPPMILCLHLQKNITDDRGNCRKSRAKITLESETLKLERTMFIDENVDIFYKLVSTIDHRGSVEIGHYKGFKKLNNKWYSVNDTSISEVEFQSVKNSELYFLVYELFYRIELPTEKNNSTSSLSTDRNDAANSGTQAAVRQPSPNIDTRQVTAPSNVNVILNMLLTSDKLIDILGDIVKPELDKLWQALKDTRDSGKQDIYCDNSGGSLELFENILESINKEWDCLEMRNSDRLSNPFTIKMKQEIICNWNHSYEDKTSSVLYLSLEVPRNVKASNGKINMRQLIQNNFEKKELNSAEYNCNRSWCNRSKLYSQQTINFAPKILFIVLRRSGNADDTKLTIDSEIQLETKLNYYSTKYNFYTLNCILINQDELSNEFIGFKRAKSGWIMFDGSGKEDDVDYNSIRDIEPLILMYQNKSW